MAFLVANTNANISWQDQCESSLGSFDECRLSAKRLPTFRPSQLTWAVSLSVEAVTVYTHRHHLLLLLDQPNGWYSLYHPTKDRRLSRPRQLVTYI